jgi:hypothetical protein
MAGSKNEHLEFFRVKAMLMIEQWADRMKLFIAENRLMGNELAALRKMRHDPESTWSIEREALNKAIKLEVAGLINRLHQAVYSGEL